jgi:hypothetical protein
MSSNRTVADPLTGAPRPDRVNYATGMLLGPEDFSDEQTYHRSRLALALGSLFGAGTVRGLKVSVSPASGDAPEQIRVSPGLALDQLGRIIELQRDACLRLDRWWEFHRINNPGALTQAFDATAGAVVARVFLQFEPCNRGLTPAFATGPFDALNAVQAARLRDGYRLSLEPAVYALGNEPRRPKRPFAGSAAELIAPAILAVNALSSPTLEQAAEAVRQAIEPQLAAMRDALLNESGPGTPNPPEGFPPEADPQGLLLARVEIPASAGNPPTSPGAARAPDNSVRGFALPMHLLAHALRLNSFA